MQRFRCSDLRGLDFPLGPSQLLYPGAGALYCRVTLDGGRLSWSLCKGRICGGSGV